MVNVLYNLVVPVTMTNKASLSIKAFADRQTVFFYRMQGDAQIELGSVEKKRNAAGTCYTANPEPVCISS